MQQAQVTSELSFRIDPIYEFSKWMQQQWNVSLTPSKGFCRREAEEAANNCVTWISDYYWHPQCSPLVNQSEILFAVKTASKFFETRIPILKATWASAVENIVYFADVEDASIPTVNCGVPNTERGHCGKLLASLHLINQNQKWKNIQFVVIADDDTLLSVERLQRLLSCYSSVPFLALGERYAYMSSQGGGYAYITGGGGMVLGMDTVRRLLVSENTLCGSDDSPDDMLLGIWLSHLRIPIVHSHLFHQARPMDYASEMVDPNYLKSVSFHKFWQVDPMRVFQHWLQEENLRANVHDEL